MHQTNGSFTSLQISKRDSINAIFFGCYCYPDIHLHYKQMLNKNVIYKHKKSAAYSYLLLSKNINTDGVGGWVGLCHVWTATKKQVKKGAKTVEITVVGSCPKPPR